MGDPEGVGNQSREECEEGIERMMVDLSPEERVAALKKRSRRNIGPPNCPMMFVWPGDAELVAVVEAAVDAALEKAAWGTHFCPQSNSRKYHAGAFCSSPGCWPDGAISLHVERCKIAVAAENERCAKVNPANVPCPKKSCMVGIGVPCEDEHNKFWIPCHPERYQAAIRVLQSPA